MRIEDWPTALGNPGFWHSYYHGRIASEEDEYPETVLERLLGADTGIDYDALFGPDPYDAITDDMDSDAEDEAMSEAMSAGSVLEIPFPAGYTWKIQFSSSPGIYHDLCTPDGEELSLGYDDPHFQLPVLRWDEVFEIEAAVRRHWQNLAVPPFPEEFLVPLFAPVAWTTSSREAAQVREALSRSWESTGMATSAGAAELAQRLTWIANGFDWAPDPMFGWINNGRHSRRNPHNGIAGIKDLHAVKRFLDTVTDHGEPRPAPATPRTAGSPGVTVAQGMLYTVAKDMLGAIDAPTGELRWHTRLVGPGVGRAAPTFSSGTVWYAAAGRGELVLHGCNGTLDPQWSIELDRVSTASLGAADTTVVIEADTGFVVGKRLHAVDLAATPPQIKWDAYLDSGFGDWSSAPVIADGRVFVASDNNYRGECVVSAFDASTGSSLWSTWLPGAAGQPVMAGDRLAVPHGALSFLDPATGETMWSTRTERVWAGTVAVSGDRLVGATCGLSPADRDSEHPQWQYTLACVRLDRREVAWRFSDPARWHSHGAVIADGVVHSLGFDDQDSTLYAVDLATGELRSRTNLAASTGLPAVEDGRVFVFVDGGLYSVKA